MEQPPMQPWPSLKTTLNPIFIHSFDRYPGNCSTFYLWVYLFFFFTFQMSWRPTYRGSKFRNVYGKVANREQSFEGIPITKNVHDNHFCAVNSKFVAVVTESAGGGSFIVIPVSQVTEESRIMHWWTHCNCVWRQHTTLKWKKDLGKCTNFSARRSISYMVTGSVLHL